MKKNLPTRVPKIMLVLLPVIILFISSQVTANNQPAQALAKIEAQLLSELSAQGQADYIVRFAEQADLSAAYQMAKLERREYVYQTLKKTAERSQAQAKSILDEAGLSYQTFIASNDLYVKQGNLDMATRLADLRQVASIRLARTYQLDLPAEQPLAEKISWSGDLLAQGLSANLDAVNATIAWGILDIKADQFWTTFGVQGDGIKVADIGTGVQWDHPALDQAYACLGDPDNPACWEDPLAACPGDLPCDLLGGSTALMGVMVGDDDPTLTYIVGMAPNATWIACNACDSGGSCPDFAVYACADWVLAPGGSPANAPDIVNFSIILGPGGDTSGLAMILAWRAAGIFPAISTGNMFGCSTLYSPGDYQESFGSAAHFSDRLVAAYSSRGPSFFGHDPYTKPNISAPGVGICSSIPTNSWNCSHSGTGMAAPHSAGAVALLWSCNPHLVGNIDMTFQALQNSADAPPAGDCGAPPDGEGNYAYGYGYLNVLAAVHL